MNQWYYGEHGKQNGPVTEAELRALISSGVLSSQVQVWRDGMSDWKPLAEMPELTAGTGSGMVAGLPYVGALGMQTSGMAIGSLVCGVIGFVTSMVCFGIGSLLGIPAVILGHLALSQIGKEPQRIEGRGLAIAGLVLGYFHVALMLVMLTMFIIALVAGTSTPVHGR